MVLLSLSKVKKSFGTDTLFEDVSFNIEEKDKIGFVGVNGAGKTTLFKILLGQMDSDGGEMFMHKDTVIGYMQQHNDLKTGRTVFDEALTSCEHLLEAEKELEELSRRIDASPDDRDRLIAQQQALTEKFQNDGGLTYKSRVKSALMGLGFSQNELYMDYDSLSGGQKTRVSLCKILLGRANLLLLDEPTNHLDIASVEWLENFLQSYNKAFVIISHDRYFLDKVTGKTFELENKAFTVYKGGYTRYLALKEESQETKRREYENTQREIKRLEGIVEQQKRWNREKNIKTAQSKQKVIDKLEQTLNKPAETPVGIDFKFSVKPGGGNDVIICENLAKAFDGKKLFESFSFHLKKGERLFLLGDNGCGKTTLFKILTDTLNADSGSFKIGSNIQIGYYDQTQESLDNSKTVLDEVFDAYPKLGITQIRNALAAFLFVGDDVFKPISMLSGGEKAKVSLVKLMLSGANLLLLDEPTNHLDISSREALENALMLYDGTLFIVSHDRYFINKLASRVIYMTQSGAQSYLGNYDYFNEKRTVADKVEQKSVEIKSSKEDYMDKKRMESERRKRQTLIARTQTEIEDTEREISRLNERLLDDDVASDYIKATEITTAVAELESKLEELYTLWDKLESENTE